MRRRPSKPQLATAARTRGQPLRHRPSGHAARRCLGLGDCRPPRRLSAPIAMSMTTTARRRVSRCWLAAGTTASSTGAARPGSAARGALRRPATTATGARRRSSPIRCAAAKDRAQGGTCPRTAAAPVKAEIARPGTARCRALGRALARRRRPAPSPARRICRAPATGPMLASGPKEPRRRPEARRSSARYTAEDSDHGCRGVPPGIARTRSPRQALGTARTDLRMPAAAVKAGMVAADVAAATPFEEALAQG